jgi:hypothetical protein
VRHPIGLAAVLAVLVAVGGVAAGGGAAAVDSAAVDGDAATQIDTSRSLQTGPTLTISDTTLAPGETSVVRVNLTAAPDGVAGFDATVTVADAAVVELTAASLADGFGLANATVVNETTVRLRGADTEGVIQATDEPVTIARVTVRAVGTGTTTLTPTGQFDSDEGTRLGVENDAGSVRVTDETATASTTPSPTASTTDGATTEESGGETTDSSGEETAASGPGLGVVGSLLALVTVAGLRRRR